MNPSTLQSPASTPHNLPPQPTPIVGRADELDTARNQLLAPGVRLLTFVGPGGVGKTRLAIALAESLAASDAFPDGRWFVDLAPLQDPSLVLSEIARALGVPSIEGKDTLATLTGYLARRRLLLVLDNLEHLLAASGDLAGLLATSPGLTLLATSRAPLRLRWERTLPLAPLPVPDPNHLPPLDQLAHVPAVALFVERARAAHPSFSLTRENARPVAQLCLRLDGLPLALELVAARAALLGPAALLDRLDRHLPLPLSAGQDTPERHQTLRAAIAWSYEQLPPPEQAPFRRLAVFVGGWSLAAAQAIVAPATPGATSGAAPDVPDVLTALTSLADKSLVQVTIVPSGDPWFRLLETVREFTFDLLAASGEADEIGRRHAAYYAGLAARAGTGMLGPEERSWVDLLEREHDNLRAALRSLLDAGQSESALAICGLLGYFWWIAGHLLEGRRWVEQSLAATGQRMTTAHPSALMWGSFLAFGQGDVETAQRMIDLAHDCACELCDTGIEAFAPTVKGLIAWRRGDSEGAIRLHRDAIERLRPLDQPSFLAHALLHLGFAEVERSPNAAIEALDESARLLRGLGEGHALTFALAGLAAAQAHAGHPDAALPTFREVLERCLEHADPITAISSSALALALLAERGSAAEALPLMEAIATYAGEIGYQFTPLDRSAHQRALAAAARTRPSAARSAPSRPPAAPSASHTGRTSIADLVRATLELIAAAQLGQDRTAPPTGSPERLAAGPLSPREQEVLALVAAGKSNREIALALIVTENTAKYHVAQLLRKLDAGSRTEAVTRAIAAGLLTARSD